MTGPAVSRADALRAYFAFKEDSVFKEDDVAGPASRLGFEYVPADPEPVTTETYTPSSASVTTAAPKESAAPRPAMPTPTVHYWRPVRVTYAEDDEDDDPTPSAGPPEIVEADIRADAPPLPPPALADGPRLRRHLDVALRTPRDSRAVDVDRLLSRLARGEGLGRRLPRRVGFGQGRLVLVLDGSPRLVPFWEDQLDLAVGLTRRLGAHRVRYLSPPRGGAAPGDPPQSLDPDEILLALTDLGFYGEDDDRIAWLRFGRRMGGAGAVLQALVPCPAWRWTDDLAKLWRPLDWTAPDGDGRRAPRPFTDGPWPDPVEALLDLLSPAVRVEPGLLRQVRRLLGEHADAATEAALWNHPRVDGASSRSLEIESERRLEGCERLARWHREGRSVPWLDDVARTVLRWHRGWADVVWSTECMHYRACGVDDAVLNGAVPGTESLDAVEHAQAVLERAAAHAEVRPAGDADPVADAARAFWVRERERSPAAAVHDTVFGPALQDAYRTLRVLDPEASLPAGMTPDLIDPEGDPEAPRRRYTVWQRGRRLVVCPSGEPGPGGRVAEIWARSPRLTVGSGRQGSVELDLGSPECALESPPPDALLELVTDVQRVELESWIRPDWAVAAGRDGYGLWASFEVEGVRQRMRWIGPHRFLMGSPESEEGRYEEEGPVHLVELTEGYWMAETPCTQELWQAFTNKNPSYFQTCDRPVEQVSWEDCQRLVHWLNFRVPGLELRLPTEAEWEAACRAATKGATWRGDLEILGENNAPGLDAIAWYGGNSGVDFDLENGVDSSDWPKKLYEHSKAGSRVVAKKAANPWGLYDILGNVWEWCWDWWGDYSSESQQDPEGPDEGSGRVIRGGSWFANARDVRTAYRGGLTPGIRDFHVGFRVSRGPLGSRMARPGRGAASPGRGVARRGSASSDRLRRDSFWVEALGWAADGGIDGYGRWADLEVSGVRHRLRWIYPGKFLMGSPEDEPGRWDDEGPQHEVTLRQGFWLGETPCTQDLWQVVMGEEPSYFQSPRRPVEQVSWEDCHAFYERLREIHPEFHGQLPTEAQWEYACRGGATGAIWKGELEIIGERNAPALHPIAWYGGNSGLGFELENGDDSSDWGDVQFPRDRSGTHEVARKLPNPWGLWDMLGNVLEWCRDGWNVSDPYPEGTRSDPFVEEGSDRVVRGGSWHDHARGVRVAYRGGATSGYRIFDVGFRISRGPQDITGAFRGTMHED